MTFQDLLIGDTFDFVGGEWPSFFKRCMKISKRRYQDENGTIHTIGTIKATVYHATPRSGTDFSYLRDKFLTIKAEA